jgi:hypothetical protein
VVQKQELRATFEKYGRVDEVYIAQAGHFTPFTHANFKFVVNIVVKKVKAIILIAGKMFNVILILFAALYVSNLHTL